MHLVFKNKYKKNFYPYLFMSYIIVITLTIIVISAILYMNFERIAQYNIFTSERNRLAQASYSAQVLADSAKTLAAQAFSDQEASKLRYFTNLEDDEMNKALARLIAYKSVNQFLYSIYLYNSSNETFYVSSIYKGTWVQKNDSFFDKEITQIIDNYGKYKYSVPIAREIPMPAQGDSPIVSTGYTYMFYDQPKAGEKIDSAIILNIKESWLRSTIDKIDLNSDGNTFIVDGNGRTVLGSIKQPVRKGINTYMEKVLSDKMSSGYFVDSVEGMKYLIMYVRYTPFDWIFISTIPYESVMENIERMRNNTVIIALLILAAGIAISVILSKSIYRPIGNMQKQIGTLQSERTENLHMLKQELLKNVVSGKKSTGLDEINKQFQSFSICLDTKSQCMILMLIIDQYGDFCTSNSLKDRELLKFAVINIASEMLSSCFINDGVDMGDDHMVIILNPIDKSNGNFGEELGNLIMEIQEAVLKHMNLSITAVVSSPGDTISYAGALYQEVTGISKLRLYLGHKSIIFAESASELNACEYQYPEDKEKVLIDGLMAGKVGEARKTYDEIVDSLKYCHKDSFFRTLNRLTYAISVGIDAIEENGGCIIPFDFGDFIVEINRKETINEVNAMFYRLFELIHDKLEEKKSSKSDERINRVIGYIKGMYMDPGLSLDSIAGKVDVSPSYLGKLFKKTTGKSLVDYVNDIRMEKAKEMLLVNTYSVNEIFEKTGYTNIQYFYKVFRKTYGTTPVEFKQNKRISQQIQ